MPVVCRFALVSLCLIAVIGPTSTSAQRTKRITTYNAYFDGSQWLPIWFQCDQARDIFLVTAPSSSRTHTLVSFQKNQPSILHTVEITQQGETENVMGGKTSWTFTTPPSGQIYTIMETDYKEVSDPEAGYWTRRYHIGQGPDLETAFSKRQECRWFPRTGIGFSSQTRHTLQVAIPFLYAYSPYGKGRPR